MEIPPPHASGVKVLVTGATGYLASHVMKLLLEAGYDVRGTVRSLKSDKTKAVLEYFSAYKDHLELVEADLVNGEGWKEAVEGCPYVLHTASPFPAAQPRDEMEVIKPAVDGVEVVLKAVAATHGAVKRVVVTSSTAACMYGHPKNVYKTKVFTEEDWTIPGSKVTPYQKSKLMAEQKAWEIMKGLPAEDQFELVAINPGLIEGPLLFKETMSSSLEFMRRIATRDLPALPELAYVMVDVRDCALLHIRALFVPEAAGKRFLCVNGTQGIWLKNKGEWLDEEFGPLGYKIPTHRLPLSFLWMYSLFDAPARFIVPDYGKLELVDNAKIVDILGAKFIHPKKTVIDTVHSMIQMGVVPKTDKYVPPGGALAATAKGKEAETEEKKEKVEEKKEKVEEKKEEKVEEKKEEKVEEKKDEKVEEKKEEKVEEKKEEKVEEKKEEKVEEKKEA